MIDGWATQPHYLDHIAPIWHALPPELRGRFHCDPKVVGHARALGLAPLAGRPRPSPVPLLVAGGWDLRSAPGRTVALVEHGAGQHYQDAHHQAHPGGPRRDRVGLYLCPNQAVADRNLAAYPAATAAVVGCPTLDRWHGTEVQSPDGPIVVSWHFDSMVAPEARSAWPHYGPAALDRLRARFGDRLVGHAHPRVYARFAHLYREHTITAVARWADVLALRPAVYVCDNSSTMFEAAALGLPVVALNAPWYRRDVEHGLRFWAHCPGPQVDHPDQLVATVEAVLTNPGPALARGARAAAAAYGTLDGQASARAADAVRVWAGRAAPAPVP